MPSVHPVKTALVQRGETQADCARAVGIKPVSLTQVLNGRAASWPGLRARVAAHLELPEAELFPDHALAVR